MKTGLLPSWAAPRYLIGILSILFCGFGLFGQTRQPVIKSILPRGTNIVIALQLPDGIQRVTLETRERLGSGAWIPAVVTRSVPAGGAMTVVLPMTRKMEMMRVRADFSEPLPGNFYGGKTNFWGVQTNLASSGGDYISVNSPTDSGSKVQREVVESDIWKIDGDNLYFFNQYRGLQIVDISKPDEASIRGELPLAAAGDQMYLADSNHVVLLTRQWCGSGDESQIVVVAVSNTPPTILAKLPVPGYIQESRMVGSALYVASQSYRPVPGTTNSVWEWGSLVSSFDFSDPSKPVVRDTLWQGGYGNVVYATDTYLFVVTQDPYNWWQSTIQVIDITAADGKMAKFTTIKASGRVIDKFKMNYEGTVFTAISEDSRNAGSNLLVTRLETFRLPDPRSGSPLGVFKLGELLLGIGERLQATRFDSNRVYVVTFLRIDPLWVADLSDPVTPRISGALEIPGWSTYIQPLGDRLVAVGVESNHVAVSLFNVADPAKPLLTSRVLLGESYSWSEANYDEKAFSVLADANLVLVPYSGDTTNGWANRMQLIDLKQDTLVARGVIEHPVQPRRAAFTKSRVLSLSGWELLSVDVSDRDKPVVKKTLELAFPVDRVLLAGDFLLQVGSSQDWWNPSASTAVTVVNPADPSKILGELGLKPLQIVGATVRGTALHLAQFDSTATYTDTNLPNFYHTTIDISKLPAMTVQGTTSTRVQVEGWPSGWVPLWINDNLLVWSGGTGWWPWLMDFWGRGGMMRPWYYGNQGSGRLVAVDVTKPAAPLLASFTDLTSTNSWWGFSKAFTAGNLVYVSHAVSEPPPDPTDPKGVWVQRYYLDVVDFADPANPTARKQVNIPGELRGVARSGELLYTVGSRWSKENTTTQFLEAVAYDGLSAHSVASLELSNSWPQTVLVSDPVVYVGVASYPQTATNSAAHALQTWGLSDSGEFVLKASLKLENPVSTIWLRDSLMAFQDTWGKLQVFDATDPLKLAPLAFDQPATCIWFDLNAAEGNREKGLFIPQGMYGIVRVQIK